MVYDTGKTTINISGFEKPFNFRKEFILTTNILQHEEVRLELLLQRVLNNPNAIRNIIFTNEKDVYSFKNGEVINYGVKV